MQAAHLLFGTVTLLLIQSLIVLVSSQTLIGGREYANSGFKVFYGTVVWIWVRVLFLSSPILPRLVNGDRPSSFTIVALWTCVVVDTYSCLSSTALLPVTFRFPSLWLGCSATVIMIFSKHPFWCFRLLKANCCIPIRPYYNGHPAPRWNTVAYGIYEALLKHSRRSSFPFQNHL